MFEKSGNPPYIELKQQVFIEYMANDEHRRDDWRFHWKGAYTCVSLGYDCGPADFAPEPEPIEEPTPVDIPDPPESVDNLADDALERSRFDKDPNDDQTDPAF